jgi:hypothetical protein
VNRTITLTDTVSPVIAAWRAALAPEVLNGTIARAEERLFRDHLAALPPNRLGKSTGFWANAARATHAEATASGCVVSINHLGVRQRFHGGEIKPVNSKYLAIPARSEFYGARARQFTNLRFILFKSGAAALVINEGGSEKITSLGASKSAGGKKSAGTVAFWLVKSVNQRPDPGVIPSDDQITATAYAAAAAALQRAMERAK